MQYDLRLIFSGYRLSWHVITYIILECGAKRCSFWRLVVANLTVFHRDLSTIGSCFCLRKIDLIGVM